MKNKEMKAKCVVTGATGLIGSSLIPLLIKDWEVYSVTSQKDKAVRLSHNVHIIQQDLAEPLDTKFFPEEVDAVIHLAQSPYFRDFPRRAEDIFKVNSLSVLQLLEYARKTNAKTFILASSGGIYGQGEEGFKEDSLIFAQNDLGFYLGTKLCSEIIAENYVDFMNVIIIRFFFVYGPKQRNDMLIPRLISRVKEGIPIILQGERGIFINPIYVTDAASAVFYALTLKESQKINVGGPEILSIREIGEIIGKVLQKEPVFKTVIESETRNLIGNIEKMSNLLWKPVVTFEEGVKKFLSNENFYGIN